jgi:hypothetical protein
MENDDLNLESLFLLPSESMFDPRPLKKKVWIQLSILSTILIALHPRLPLIGPD